MNSLSRMDHFDTPVAPAQIVRRREAVLISIRIGRGRVPSAWPIKSDRDQDLYRQLPWLPARSVLDFVQTARFSTSHSNPPVSYSSGVRPPPQSKQKRGLCSAKRQTADAQDPMTSLSGSSFSQSPDASG